MADSRLSDAEKIRNKRLAKLGGQGSPSGGPNATPAAPGPSSSSPQLPAAQADTSSSAPQPNPFTQLGVQQNDAPAATAAAPPATQTPPPAAQPPPPSPPQQQQQSEAAPPAAPKPRQITITPKPAASAHTPSKRDASSEPPSRPRSRQQDGRTERDSPEAWEDRTLRSIFRVTLKGQGVSADVHGNKVVAVPGVAAELREAAEEKGPQGQPLRLTVGVLEQAIFEAAQNVAATPGGNPLDYLLGCWKRVARQARQTALDKRSGQRRLEVVNEAKRLCMSYCIFAFTMPEMFEWEPPAGENQLAKHLLVDPENDRGICHDFVSEAVKRFDEDDTMKTAIVEAAEDLSDSLAKMSMNDGYKPYVLAFRNLVQFAPIVQALAGSEKFNPPGTAPEKLEKTTLLGPLFQLSPMQGEVAQNYFSSPKTRDRRYIENSQNALRMTLRTHQDELFDIVSKFIRTSAETRERTLDWFAAVVNSNHKRRAMRVDPKTTSSDGFMINVTVVLDRLCEPFMDATFSKIDRIDVNYLRRNPRVAIADETKMNADQHTSDEFYSQKVDGTNNFISEVFFLTVAAHHYGTEAANANLSTLQREVKHLEKQVEEFERERHKFSSNPQQLQLFENAVKKYKDQVERGHCIILATQGVLLDDLTQARSMQFMRYVITWMLRLVSGVQYPRQPLSLPLPAEQPQVFKCLPEYFLEDVVDNFKFITKNMPGIITSTQCEELITVCMTFLRNSEYIRNPYLKAGLITILFHGVWPLPKFSKGVLGDLLFSSPFAVKHLLHSVMKFFIEAESTGGHNQFFDKFNIRYEIFQIIRCIWGNPAYRENLDAEARDNIDFFVQFVNLLLNDVTFVLDESITAFINIHNLTQELRNPAHLDEQLKKEKEESLESAKNKAKSYMSLTNETVSMLKLFTEALVDAFTKPEIVQRLADMLDYNLDILVGPKSSNLRVEEPEAYQFRPKELLSDLIDIFINLGAKESFRVAVARDGRSYKPANFEKARSIMAKVGLKSSSEMKAWDELGKQIAAAKEADEQVEEDLGEIPDEFLDPVMYTLMEDPVILPTSRITVDRSTIRSHLLSDPTDPFNRMPLKIEEVIPDTETKEKIEAFKAQKKAEKLKEREAATAAASGVEPMDTSA
ncbi:ubiquitin elongating factor core-domain-containing protein [Lineolata rhizophorae]|uniref:Ubiquitin elongating factor core-domain-containing protein n=1 Tax=Lineolata rhizophorae TaxID=578093 RepID=A0A6A6PCD5_9PEZI|nr:ubiquitin elongating factor core-domain-containing protein [Lineolata rhizophorae]